MLKPTLFALVLSTVLLSACSSSKTPPGADSIFAMIDETNTNITLLQWKDGLQIVFADNYTSHNSHGHGSSSEPFHIQTGSAKSKEDAGYEWVIKTADGKNAEIKIAGKSYDIKKGNFFVVQNKDNKLLVEQHKLDLPHPIRSTKELAKAADKNADFATWTKNLRSQTKK